MRILGSWKYVMPLLATGCGGLIYMDDAGVNAGDAGTLDAGTPDVEGFFDGPVFTLDAAHDASPDAKEDAPPGCGTGPACSGNNDTCCDGVCVDTATDPNNCGGCGGLCLGIEGTCCESTCANTAGDPKNCGGCGVACSGVSQGACEDSMCVMCMDDIGTCAHSPCESGAALDIACDPDGVNAMVCLNDISCCTVSWTAACAAMAKKYDPGACYGCL
jgi:hypothetical protein